MGDADGPAEGDVEETDAAPAIEGANEVGGGASSSHKGEPPPSEELLTPDLFGALQLRKVRLLSYLSLVSAAGAFRASKKTRQLLSSRLSVVAAFDVNPREEMRGPLRQQPAPAVTKDSDYARRNRLVLRTRARLPHSAADSPLRVYLRLYVSEVPIRVSAAMRTLARCVPMVQWPACERVLLKSRGALHSLDRTCFNKIGALAEADELEFLADPTIFGSLQRLTLSVTAVSNLPADLHMPQVRRLKVMCHDSQFSTATVASLYKVFPRLNRLHLALVPSGLLPLCGPGFSAPPDFRISLLIDGKRPPLDNGEAPPQTTFFVASHLLSLPFSWSGALFQNVIRLQMTELSQDHLGLANEQLAEILRSMPHLRRLGTVSVRMFQLVDVTREDCQLEELVIIMSMMDVVPVFKAFLNIEQSKRRSSLIRLAVHLHAWDGVGRPTVEVENSLCAGWNAIARSLLRPTGSICFSFAHRRLTETAIAQLAWFDPLIFSVDWQDYEGEGRLPGSTALDCPLLFPSTEEIARPRGTLVAGSLRPGSEEMREDALNTPSSTARVKSKLGSTLNSTGGLTSRSLTSSPGPRGSSKRGTSRHGSVADVGASMRNTFTHLALIEAYDHLSKLKEAQDKNVASPRRP